MKRFPGKFLSAYLRLGGSIILLSLAVVAQVPSPRSVLGFNPTDDKTIADWTQITNYFSRLDAGSNRVTVKEIGKTTLGKPLIVAFISSPDNHQESRALPADQRKARRPATIKDAAELENLHQERQVDRLDLVLDPFHRDRRVADVDEPRVRTRDRG
jgi:hypothetical protein